MACHRRGCVAVTRWVQRSKVDAWNLVIPAMPYFWKHPYSLLSLLSTKLIGVLKQLPTPKRRTPVPPKKGWTGPWTPVQIGAVHPNDGRKCGCTWGSRCCGSTAYDSNKLQWYPVRLERNMYVMCKWLGRKKPWCLSNNPDPLLGHGANWLLSAVANC